MPNLGDVRIGYEDLDHFYRCHPTLDPHQEPPRPRRCDICGVRIPDRQDYCEEHYPKSLEPDDLSSQRDDQEGGLR